MTTTRFSRIFNAAAHLLSGLAGVAFVTAISFFLHRTDIPSLLYLFVVVLEALFSGFWYAALISIVASLCLDFFFVPPILDWRISNAADLIALLTYLLISLIITRLALRAKRDSEASKRRQKDANGLYRVASRLLLVEPDYPAAVEALRIIREEFQLRAAAFFDFASAQLTTAGDFFQDLPEATRDSCVSGKDYQSPDGAVTVICIQSGRTTMGAVGFEGSFDDASVPRALAVLAATAVDRGREFRNATRAAADAQAETLRSAILDAFAHEFKTPLAIIMAAAGGLRETSPVENCQTEMMDLIEGQAMRLSRLTARLLRIAGLDRDEVAPALRTVELPAVMRNVVAQCEERFGREIAIECETAGEMGIRADPELLGLALAQLLDNACKYSGRGSLIVVRMGASHGFFDVRVTNGGSAVAPEEQERIFERFTRGVAGRKVRSGSGLGLYVARKIVRAHGGFLDLDRSQSSNEKTTFRLRLPAAHLEDCGENDHERNDAESSCETAAGGR